MVERLDEQGAKPGHMAERFHFEPSHKRNFQVLFHDVDVGTT
jgi:hypothetical protein